MENETEVIRESEINTKEKEDEERIKEALKDLLASAGFFFIISFVYFLGKASNFGIIKADLTIMVIAQALGQAIGITILPLLIALVFKNKSRAFVIGWFILLFLSLTAFIYELSQMNIKNHF